MVMKASTLSPQKRKPAPAGKATSIDVLLEPNELTGLDAWIASQAEPRPTRPEAIRRILAEALAKTASADSIPIEELNASNDE
jgi:hypothetical protein